MSNSTVSLILALVGAIFFISLGVGVSNIYAAQSCPAGYKIIKDITKDPEVNTICGGTDQLKDIVCCSKENNPFEIIRWDLKNKEISRRVDTGDFDYLYGKDFTCKGEVTCGRSGVNEKQKMCAGVACPDNQVCLVEIEKNKKVGKCVEGFDIEEKEVIVLGEADVCGRLVESQDITNGETFYYTGTNCNPIETSLGKEHCVIETQTNPRCTGNI